MFYFLHYLHQEKTWRLVFNLFRYVTLRAACAAATAFLVTVLFLPWLIRRLKRSQIVDTAEDRSEKLAELQRGKPGTPTMGGLGILAGVLGAGLLWANPANAYVQLTMGAVLALGLIGFADDWTKLSGRGKQGIPGWHKFALQTLVAIGIAGALILRDPGPFGQSFASTRLAVPFVKPEIFAPDLGVGYIVLVLFLVVGSSNAVNLTDGLDGLAAGCSTVAALAYAALVYVAGHAVLAGYLNLPFIRGAEEVTVLCAAMGGAMLGFLWYNSHPAQIIMGDTGSLATGGLLAVAACVAKQELLLGLVGAVFVAEAGSVILQVASFKTTGRRIFLMAPLHHHFQLKGWSEEKVVVRFWIVAIVCALLSVATLKVR